VHRLSQNSGTEFKITMNCTQIALLLVGTHSVGISQSLELLNLDVTRATGGSSCMAAISQHSRMLLAFLPQPVAWAGLTVLIGIDLLVKRWLGAFDPAESRLS
jgi:hypothetical protein